MKKKAVKKKTANKGKGVSEQSLQNSERESSDRSPKDSEFDFGGLPQRDLKKNLGCG